MDHNPPSKPPSQLKFADPAVQAKWEKFQLTKRQEVEGLRIERYGYIDWMTLAGDWKFKKEGKNSYTEWREFESGTCTATIYSAPSVFGLKADIEAFQHLVNSSDASPAAIKQCMEKLLGPQASQIESAEIKRIGRRNTVLVTT
ncbi:MAG: hypothetical protein K2Z81_10130, partial [Cyanobacteria bacterium]|nr:hypothetical protein [Cyanobacteriota bacterium]